MSTAFEVADGLTDGLMTTLKDVLDNPLDQAIANTLEEGTSVLDLYKTAEALRVIFSLAYAASHRLNTIASNLRIEELDDV